MALKIGVLVDVDTEILPRRLSHRRGARCFGRIGVRRMPEEAEIRIHFPKPVAGGLGEITEAFLAILKSVLRQYLCGNIRQPAGVRRVSRYDGR